MNTLPENLIDKIMLYVSHPCADIMRNSFHRVGSKSNITIRTQEKRSRITKLWSFNVFQLRVDTSEEHERRYERKVIKRYIYNKFKLFCINENKMNHFTCLYLHFNRILLDERDEIELPDYEEYNIESDIESDYNDDA